MKTTQEKYIIAIGGGEIRNKQTLVIDEYIANLAKKKAGDKRAMALFFPTASHDSKPYFNSFRKTYTSHFDIKADVALLTRNEMSLERVQEKIDMCDLIYVGGGDTKYMLDLWKETGIDKSIVDAYNKGVPIAGLSAGAICWFSQMYTDYDILRGQSQEYKILDGLGLLEGLVTPHYEERTEFDALVLDQKLSALALENNSAVVFVNGQLKGALTSGGNAYMLSVVDNQLDKSKIPLL